MPTFAGKFYNVGVSQRILQYHVTGESNLIGMQLQLCAWVDKSSMLEQPVHVSSSPDVKEEKLGWHCQTGGGGGGRHEP